jgi:transposase
MVVDGLSGVEVSKKLGVNDSVIYRWEKEQLNEMEGVVEEYGQASPKEMSEEIHR